MGQLKGGNHRMKALASYWGLSAACPWPAAQRYLWPPEGHSEAEVGPNFKIYLRLFPFSLWWSFLQDHREGAKPNLPLQGVDWGRIGSLDVSQTHWNIRRAKWEKSEYYDSYRPCRILPVPPLLLSPLLWRCRFKPKAFIMNILQKHPWWPPLTCSLTTRPVPDYSLSEMFIILLLWRDKKD